jgi:hypothetical protein
MLDYKKWKKLSIKKNLEGKEALEAVRRDGHALRYVEERIFLKDKIKVIANGKEVLISKDSAKSLGLV